MSESTFICPYCKKEYQTDWVSHPPKCIFNPENLKLFCQWLTSFVLQNSTKNRFAVSPKIVDIQAFLKENDIVSVHWLRGYLNEEDPVDIIHTILEYGFINGYLTYADMPPFIVYMFDAHLFKPIFEFIRDKQNLEALDDLLLSYES